MRHPEAIQVPLWEAIQRFSDSPRLSNGQEEAVCVVNDIVAREIERRDVRITELEGEIQAARAEVPEWCKDFVLTIRSAWLLTPGVGFDVKIDRDAIDRAIESLTPAQLRACGLDVP